MSHPKSPLDRRRSLKRQNFAGLNTGNRQMMLCLTQFMKKMGFFNVTKLKEITQQNQADNVDELATMVSKLGCGSNLGYR